MSIKLKKEDYYQKEVQKSKKYLLQLKKLWTQTLWVYSKKEDARNFSLGVINTTRPTQKLLKRKVT